MKTSTVILLCAVALVRGGNNNNGANVNVGSNNKSTYKFNLEEAPTICAGADPDNIIIANEHCDKFYKCAHGKPVVMQCPPNTLYNPLIEVCDWASNVECGDRVISKPEDESGNSTCNCNPAEAPSICAGADSDNILIANENCEKFYKCAHGEPVAIQCPPNTLYNPFIEVCDWPRNVVCGDRVISKPEDESDESTCNCNPAEAPSICAGADSDNILIANENCEKFYKCAHGKPVAIQCPPNTLYNPYIEACDWPRNVECGDRVISKPEDESDESTCNCNPAEAPSICAGADSDNILIANENCEKFYKCAHGKPVAIQCPPNTLYNPFIEVCDWPRNVECGDRVISKPEDESDESTCNCNPAEAPFICAGADSDNILVANENCEKFYKCAHGKPVAIQCPPNTLYNPFKEVCDWPRNVECGDRVISESKDESGTDDSKGDDGSDGNDIDSNNNGENDNSGNNNNSTCNCNPKEAPSICAGADSDNILIANENCDKFYKCAHGKPVAIKCPPNTLYNPFKEVCDWSRNVECGDRVISESKHESDQ